MLQRVVSAHRSGVYQIEKCCLYSQVKTASCCKRFTLHTSEENIKTLLAISTHKPGADNLAEFSLQSNQEHIMTHRVIFTHKSGRPYVAKAYLRSKVRSRYFFDVSMRTLSTKTALLLNVTR